MSSPAGPPALRRLSHLELFSSSRHHLGIYRCVIVTCRYQPSLPSAAPLDAAALYPALGRIVAQQPMLRVGILGQDTNQARFSHLAAIDLREHVAFRTLECDAEARYEDLLAESVCWHHGQLWANVETRAPWKLVVLRPGDGIRRETPFQDVLFVYHHALMDGTSGRQFHELLLAALNDPELAEPSSSPSYSSLETPHLLSFPDTPRLPEGQDEAVPFRNSILFTIKTLWNELGPSLLRAHPLAFWNGIPIDFRLPHKACVRAVDIAPDVVASLLRACKQHAVSLTPLLHALTLASLSRRLPAAEAASFAGDTPISLRPWFGPGADVALRPLLRALLTGMTHTFPSSVVDALRSPDADVDALVWEASRTVKADLAAKLASLPTDDVGGLMKYVGDWFKYWKRMDGQPHPDSWGVSNLGVLSGAGPIYSITRFYFTNGPMVAGSPIGVNAGSVAGSALTVTITWQDAVVPTQLMAELAGDLATLTQRLHETGSFST